jgi:hypothetical protein
VSYVESELAQFSLAELMQLLDTTVVIEILPPGAYEGTRNLVIFHHT